MGWTYTPPRPNAISPSGSVMIIESNLISCIIMSISMETLAAVALKHADCFHDYDVARPPPPLPSLPLSCGHCKAAVPTTPLRN